ncbi:thiamine biosynthesis protein ThiJ [Porphyromonas gulae]|uniref:Thiamine biosynthesis protein ThiJ n=1 Tax=Porphyromonas gulae TaxID=111105 RepID=A0A099WMM8_9PORP|nr:DJ-1 family glyoxalase III [Porphyromonas gulae]KGL47004.1 thiamine biosynthesis protein ThiJ [Porphyromonas gulae]KGN75383.1 thiamine biosynthesis protein ThiJ [Porphyromonas gulae]KGN78069.1 thiamine biosynthesis protein ThiJ [Porphyromonas gulae]KGN84442.1 thiamine biosynthesis protein ThiJ [Porphyromonas gulae]KGN86157.1 thiamine biosynthesis protein ThiJ [Porphyromonas gulae]
MKKTALVFLAPGFEETEAVGTLDILRRGGVAAEFVSITDSLYVEGANGITVKADRLMTDLPAVDALVLPGGLPGADNLNSCEPLRRLLSEHYAAQKLVAAICAAPLVFGGLGFVRGRKATCYPGFESKLEGADYTGEAATRDGHVITGKGPACVFAFAIEVVRYLCGDQVADEIAAGTLFR